MPPAVEKLWTTCASYFAPIKKSDEVFLAEKGLEILGSWGVDAAAIRKRAVRLPCCRDNSAGTRGVGGVRGAVVVTQGSVGRLVTETWSVAAFLKIAVWGWMGRLGSHKG